MQKNRVARIASAVATMLSVNEIPPPAGKVSA